MAPTGDAVNDGPRQAVDAAMNRTGNPDDVAAVILHDCLSRWFSSQMPKPEIVNWT